jgi:uncharacterized protein YdeI (YjbR/CyaY-like superfamily)
MVSGFEHFITKGCGRCERYDSPACSVHRWADIILELREMILSLGLEETIKWSQPCYTHQGKNVVMISALKEHASLSFLKGSLITDEHQLLEFAGKHSGLAKLIKLTSLDQLRQHERDIQLMIKEAMQILEEGRVPESPAKTPEWPAELSSLFEEDPKFKKAFLQLTPGRQRGYLITFSGAKQSATRLKRIQKYRDQILQGLGLHDHYKKRSQE